MAGAITTVVIQKWVNRRTLFTYSVLNSQVGSSAEDKIYGSVKITWNDHPVSCLYLSTVELINQSAKDFESVTVRIYTNNNTQLLTEKTEIVGTTRILDLTDDYKKELAVPEGNQLTESQIYLYTHRRDYIVPTMNRGQIVCFDLLNNVEPDTQPEIWLEVLQKGINCKLIIAHNQVMGVPQPTAALVGTLVGLVAVLALIYMAGSPIIALISYLIGLFVLYPGAYAVKSYRKLRDWLTG